MFPHKINSLLLSFTLAFAIIFIANSQSYKFIQSQQTPEEVIQDLKGQVDVFNGWLKAEMAKRKNLQEKATKQLCESNVATLLLAVLIEQLLPDKPAIISPGFFNPKKKDLSTGEYVFFNKDNTIFGENFQDNNGYILPHLIKAHLSKGVYIHHNEEQAYVYVPKEMKLYRCDLYKVIFPQRVILFSWK